MTTQSENMHVSPFTTPFTTVYTRLHTVYSEASE